MLGFETSMINQMLYGLYEGVHLRLGGRHYYDTVDVT